MKDETYYAGSRDQMLAYLPPSFSTLLEVGCSRGGFLRLVGEGYPKARLLGLESDAAAAAEAAAIGLDVSHGIFPEDIDIDDHTMDCVVFNDVLEHIADPWGALDRTLKLLTPNGRAVVSLPNLRNTEIFQELFLQGDFRYRDEGVLDSTHLRFFTFTSAARMFEHAGFTVERIEGIKPYRGRRARLLRLALGTVSPSFRNEGLYRQIAIVARPASAR